MAGDNTVLSTAMTGFPRQITIKPGDVYVYDANGKSIAVNVLPGGAAVAHAPVTGLSTTADPTITAAGASFTVSPGREQLTASGNGSAVVYNTIT